jgi:hypothetical protein
VSWPDVLIGSLLALMPGAFFLGQGFGIKQESRAWERMVKRERHGG